MEADQVSVSRLCAQKSYLFVDDRSAIERGKGRIEFAAKVGQHHGRRREVETAIALALRASTS